MNTRLAELVQYKTGGRQTDFAAIMGWSSSYLGKLLKGESIGLSPVLTILERLPEINARWLLFGKGEMLEIGKLYNLQREALSQVQAVLDLEKYMVVMSPEELNHFEDCIVHHKMPDFEPELRSAWEERLALHNQKVYGLIEQEYRKTATKCRTKKANK